MGIAFKNDGNIGGWVIYMLCSTLKYLFSVLNPQEMSVSFSAYARKQWIKLVDTWVIKAQVTLYESKKDKEHD